MNIEVNYIAVLVASIAGMVVGFVWYHPSVLGKPWMRLSGRTKESLEKEKKDMPKVYGISYLLALVTAYVLFHVMTLSLNFFNYAPLMTGLTSAFWMWLGFIMPVQLTGHLFGDKNWKLFGINTGYQLVSLLIMGLVLGYLG
ncbi:MAG: DUF1761 domain-containing protein [Patescibacteria group bacterium]